MNWWKDWRGECAAIIASGPSTKKEDVEALCNRIHVIAIKENVDLCPWADLVYGCDGPWWKNRNGLQEFKGLKLTYDVHVCSKYPGLHKINIKKDVDRILTDVPGLVGSGGNSGFQALNIAVQFGVTGVLLIGFDMSDRGGLHWYGRNNGPGRTNPTDNNFKRWRKAFEGAAPELKSRGIDVINVSPTSVLSCFRRANVEQALRGWGL